MSLYITPKNRLIMHPLRCIMHNESAGLYATNILAHMFTYNQVTLYAGYLQKSRIFLNFYASLSASPAHRDPFAKPHLFPSVPVPCRCSPPVCCQSRERRRTQKNSLPVSPIGRLRKCICICVRRRKQRFVLPACFSQRYCSRTVIRGEVRNARKSAAGTVKRVRFQLLKRAAAEARNRRRRGSPS